MTDRRLPRKGVSHMVGELPAMAFHVPRSFSGSAAWPDVTAACLVIASTHALPRRVVTRASIRVVTRASCRLVADASAKPYSPFAADADLALVPYRQATEEVYQQSFDEEYPVHLGEPVAETTADDLPPTVPAKFANFSRSFPSPQDASQQYAVATPVSASLAGSSGGYAGGYMDDSMHGSPDTRGTSSVHWGPNTSWGSVSVPLPSTRQHVAQWACLAEGSFLPCVSCLNADMFGLLSLTPALHAPTAAGLTGDRHNGSKRFHRGVEVAESTESAIPSPWICRAR